MKRQKMNFNRPMLFAREEGIAVGNPTTKLFVILPVNDKKAHDLGFGGAASRLTIGTDGKIRWSEACYTWDGMWYNNPLPGGRDAYKRMRAYEADRVVRGVWKKAEFLGNL